MKKLVARRKTQTYSSYLRTKAILEFRNSMYKINLNAQYGTYAGSSISSIGKSLDSFIEEQVKNRKLVKARLKINPKNTYEKYM